MSHIHHSLQQHVLRYLGTVQELDGETSIGYTKINVMDIVEFISLSLPGDTDPVNTAGLVLEELKERELIEDARTEKSSENLTLVTLTPKGYKLAMPELTSQGLAGLIANASKKAIFNSFSTLGIIGGPLALASIFSGLIEWRGPVLWLVSFWSDNVTQTFATILTAFVRPFGITSIPYWLADYVGLGILVSISALKSTKVRRIVTPIHSAMQRSHSKPVYRKRVLSWFLWALYFIFLVVVWPFLFVSQLVVNSFLLYGLYYKRNSLGPGLILQHQPRYLAFELSTFILPVILFLALAIANQVL